MRGYRATEPEKFSDGLVKRMEFYVLDGRTVLKMPNSIVIQGATAVNPVRNRIQLRT